MSVRPTRRASALALVGLLAMPLTMTVATAGVAAAAAPCKVAELGRSGSRGDLQAALDRARDRATLVVTGTCTGAYTVSRSVTLRKGATAGVIKGSGGRALHVTGGTLTVIGLRLTGSTAPDCPAYTTYLCGAVLLNESRVVLDRVTVAGSLLDGGDTKNVYGSALFNRPNATMTIKRSTIADNVAINSGVGLQADAVIANEGTMSIVRSTVRSNSSSGDKAYGGALYTYQSTSRTTVVESTFAGNVADGGSYAEGGAIAADQGSVRILRSLFSGNRASGVASEGGAMMVSTGNAAIDDSTFTGNQADRGGAIDVYDTGSAVTVRGSTIARNTASTGGGIAQADPSSVRLGSTIMALNTASASGADCAGTATSTGYNLIGTGDGCTGFADAVKHDRVGTNASPINPRLGTLAANGGPTKTLALQARSPAIDKAGPARCDTAKDQRGVKRPKGKACDIGAFEKQ